MEQTIHRLDCHAAAGERKEGPKEKGFREGGRGEVSFFPSGKGGGTFTTGVNNV